MDNIDYEANRAYNSLLLMVFAQGQWFGVGASDLGKIPLVFPRPPIAFPLFEQVYINFHVVQIKWNLPQPRTTVHQQRPLIKRE